MALKTVFHEGNALLTSQEVLDQMGLKNMQNITEEQMWSIIELNSAQFVGDMEMRRLAGEKNIPDTSRLRAMLERR